MNYGKLVGFALTASGVALAAQAQQVTPPGVTALNRSTDLIRVVPNGNSAVGDHYATAAQIGQIGPGLYTTTATAATGTGTTEQTLGTYSVPASFWNATGRRLKMRAAYHFAANGNNKTVKCYFGASVISSGTLTANDKNGYCDVEVVKTGSSTQIVWASMLNDTTPITPYVNASSTETDTAAIVMKVTGTDGTSNAGDIVLDDMYIVAIN